jgi:hypothetical protein
MTKERLTLFSLQIMYFFRSSLLVLAVAVTVALCSGEDNVVVQDRHMQTPAINYTLTHYVTLTKDRDDGFNQIQAGQSHPTK